MSSLAGLLDEHVDSRTRANIRACNWQARQRAKRRREREETLLHAG